MKKVFFVLFAILAISYFSTVQLPLVIAGETKAFIGTIESIKPCMARPPKWYCATFAAVADNKENKEFWILGLSGSSPTSVVDFEGKPMDKPGYNHRPHVGRKVEVVYTTAENGHNDAISVRYVPVDFVPQAAVSTEHADLNPISPVITATTSADNILVGKVVKGGVTFSLRCPYRFVIVTDNGETKDIWIPRGSMRITGLNGNSVYGAPPRARKRMEIKYLIGDNGQYEAVSMRYVP